MTDTSSDRRWRKIRDPRAARFLADPQQRPYLAPFLAGESTIGNAASLLGISNDDMYYRTKRMQRLGILEITRTEARAGRAIKHYSIRAGGLFVPFSATPAETLEALLLGTDTAFEGDLTRGLVKGVAEVVDDPESWGFRIFKDERGNTHFDYAPEDAPEGWDVQEFLLSPECPPLTSVWTTVKLTREHAKELQRELNELQQKYQRLGANKGETSRAHLLRLALAPLK